MHILALHVSNSLLKLRGRGGGPTPTLIQFATFACLLLQCALCIMMMLMMISSVIRTERESCNVASKLISCNFPGTPPPSPLPVPSLSKHYEESCNYKESTFTPCQVQTRQRATKKQLPPSLIWLTNIFQEYFSKPYFPKPYFSKPYFPKVYFLRAWGEKIHIASP